MRIRVAVPGVQELLRKKGLTKDGDVQMFLTMNINRRIGRYMPHLTGVTETKLKFIRSSTEIEVVGPHVHYQYFGKKMVNSKTGKGPAYIPGIGFRYRSGTVLKTTDIPLQYTKTHNPLAGPFWDKRMIAAEGKAIKADTERYIARRKGNV